jgi:hypothetical protein
MANALNTASLAGCVVHVSRAAVGAEQWLNEAESDAEE